MIRCLIVAGGSYVGRYIVRTLSEAGFRVDFTYRTRSPAISMLENLSGVRSFQRDFSLPISLEGEYDVIINSCGAYSAGSFEDDQLVMPNVNSAIAILELARRSLATRLILNFSSLSVYGWPLPGLVTPATRAAPTDTYGTTKLLSEQLLVLACETAAVVNLRFPVVLGKNAHRAFLPTVLNRLLSNESITMSNCDERYFACTSLRAVANLTIGLMRNPPAPGTVCSPPLACHPDLTIREAVEFMKERVSSSSELVEKKSTSPSTMIDCAEAIALGYAPPILSACLADWLKDEGFVE